MHRLIFVCLRLKVQKGECPCEEERLLANQPDHESRAPNAVKIETSGREPLVLRRLVFASDESFVGPMS